jgi:hypothetical protein
VDRLHQIYFAAQYRALISEKVVQRETDPRDVHGFGPIAHRRDEIPVFERDRTVERLESLARQIKNRLGKVDSVIVHHLRSLERVDSRSSVTTSDIQEPKRLDGFLPLSPCRCGAFQWEFRNF